MIKPWLYSFVLQFPSLFPPHLKNNYVCVCIHVSMYLKNGSPNCGKAWTKGKKITPITKQNLKKKEIKN